MSLIEIVLSSVLGVFIIAFMTYVILMGKRMKVMSKTIDSLSTSDKILEKNQYNLNKMLINIENLIKKNSQDIAKIRSTFEVSVVPCLSQKNVITALESKIKASETSIAVLKSTLQRYEAELSETQDKLRNAMSRK